jgi:5'-methylthioadenosine phosphorylase
MKIGVISGRGIPGLAKDKEEIIVETSFGDTLIEIYKHDTHEIFFINRHGEKSNLPPHRVNYLANIQAFDSAHVESIIGIGTVGSMKNEIKPGDFVIPHDFIDSTKSRRLTFFDDKRVHVDMTNPFCPSLRESLIENCKKIKDITFHEEGVYLTTEGPRLETASEIKFFSNFADVVGMTLVPEVVLAREKGICYASLCVVCNMAAGLQRRLTADEISVIFNEKESIVSEILRLTIKSMDSRRGDCSCKGDLKKATL